ncbi:MAG: adenylyl-sulfate kinase [Desulfovibrio sp.]|nr:adenylyl-sulfate kinase [Desulfovibrio sp.]
MAKTFLLTGLSGAGKTTLAALAQERLRDEFDLLILDGDEIRAGLNVDLGFAPEHRRENIRRCGELAKLLAKQGKSAILAVIAPYESLRSELRKIVGAENLRVIHINCPLELCVRRDPKKNYQKALSGHLRNYTGLADIYEPPANADLVLNTHQNTIEKCAIDLANFIREELSVRSNIEKYEQ